MQLTSGLQTSLQQTPERIVTTFRGRRQRYRAFGSRVARMAGALRSMGLADGDRVAVLAQNSDRWLELMMAVWWAGGVLQPLNNRWSAAEVGAALADAGTRILFLGEHYLQMAEALRESAGQELTLVHLGAGATPGGMLSGEHLVEQAAPVADAGRGGEDLACIAYTSGTTGPARPVMLSHRNLWCSCAQRMTQQPGPAASRVLHALPLSRVSTLSRALVQFMAGEAHVLVPAFDPLEVLETIEREAVTEAPLAPEMMEALTGHPFFFKHDMSSLQHVVYGASPMSTAAFERRMEPLPRVRFHQFYELSEACAGVAFGTADSQGAAGHWSVLSHSAGRPAFGVQVRIADAQGRELPRGEVGEVLVRGPAVTPGYWKRPDDTLTALREGWFHTGDCARMDEDGYLFIVGRLSEVVTCKDTPVHPYEVERSIAEHPAVRACAVIGVSKPRGGESLHAVIVPEPGSLLTAAQIREYCERKLPLLRRPQSIELRDTLPMSAPGKVLKRELRAQRSE